MQQASTKDILFKVSGSDILYCDVLAYGNRGGLYGDFVDDIGLQIIELGKNKKSEKIIVESDLRGTSSESAFAILPKGNYIARLSHRQNLDGKKTAVPFKLEFDTKTFKKSSVVPNDPLFSNDNNKNHILIHHLLIYLLPENPVLIQNYLRFTTQCKTWSTGSIHNVLQSGSLIVPLSFFLFFPI